MTRRAYEEIGDLTLDPEVEERVEAAVAQAELDVPPAPPSPKGSAFPATLFVATFCSSAFLLVDAWTRTGFGVGVGVVNLLLLAVLRLQVHDHLVARSFGVDMVLREDRPPRIRVIRTP